MNDRIKSCNEIAGAAPYTDIVSDGGLDPRNQPPVSDDVAMLRKQLDEARELLRRSFNAPSMSDAQKWYKDVDAWLEANK